MMVHASKNACSPLLRLGGWMMVCDTNGSSLTEPSKQSLQRSGRDVFWWQEIATSQFECRSSLHGQPTNLPQLGDHGCVVRVQGA